MSCPRKEVLLLVGIEISDAGDHLSIRIDQIGEGHAFASSSKQGYRSLLREALDGAFPRLMPVLFLPLKLKGQGRDGASVERDGGARGPVT